MNNRCHIAKLAQFGSVTDPMFAIPEPRDAE
jgi:hypothetical protein